MDHDNDDDDPTTAIRNRLVPDSPWNLIAVGISRNKNQIENEVEPDRTELL